MLIRTYFGVSIDGFAATPDGRPTVLAMPDFDPGRSWGFPEFLDQVDAVLMGRTTFEPALDAPSWPWPGKRVYVVTSRPLPAGAPQDVISTGGPSDVLEQLREARLDGDVHLVGGPRTIQTFLELEAIDRLEILLLPIRLGSGLPFSPPGANRLPLRLSEHRAFPDGTVHLAYTMR